MSKSKLLAESIKCKNNFHGNELLQQLQDMSNIEKR